jgi:palmitoyltransferase ZDHHC13/17
MIDFLERCGANMKTVNNKHEDLLFMAVENNHLKTVAYLIEHREGKLPFNTNAQNIEGNTPLHVAAIYGHVPLVSYFLSLPREEIDVDAVNNEGLTPLMLAVNGGFKEIVKRMLVKGVDRHVKNNQDERAIDMAKVAGKQDLVRVLNDEFTGMEKLKIACNVKIVYEVEKPTVVYCITFLVFFHLLFLPSNALVEVTLLETPYVFYAIAGLYYVSVLVIFGLLTRKHPKKSPKDILDLELPLCTECREWIRPNEYHCFICGVCVWRYDHHCPWINNCVSTFNIGKFTLFLCLLILACVEVIFVSMSLQLECYSMFKRTTLLPIDEGLLDTIILVNCIIATLLAVIAVLLLFNLLGDQLKNIFSDTTSYERAKQVQKESLLSAQDRVSLNESEP